MECKNCGYNNIDGAVFCAGCGSVLEPVEKIKPISDAPEDPDTTDQSKNNNIKKIQEKKIIITAVVLIVLIILAVIISAAFSDSNTGKQSGYHTRSEDNSDYASIYSQADDYFLEGNYIDAAKLYNQIPESNELYSDAQGKIQECINVVLSQYDSIEGIDTYLNAIQDLNNLSSVVHSADVDNRIVELKGICTDEIISTASAYESTLQYDEAISLIDKGLAVYSDATLTSLKDRLSADKLQLSEKVNQNDVEPSSKYSGKKVSFITHTGSFNERNQSVEYSITPSYSGNHRFDVSEMMNGFEINIKVVSSNGTTVGGSSYGLSNGEGVTVNLNLGEKYTIVVSDYSGSGSYKLTIGQTKESVDVSNCNVINDSIEFADQMIYYYYTASSSGKFRFDLSNMVNGFEINVNVLDELNYSIGGSSYGMDNKSGFTVDMEKGCTYRIKVSEYSKMGNYTISIGRPHPTRTIKATDLMSGSLTYKDQQDKYEFVAPSTGEFNLTLNGMPSGSSCNIIVYDELNYNVGGTSYGLESSESITANLTSGKKYLVVISQYSGFGSYNVKMTKKMS